MAEQATEGMKYTGKSEMVTAFLTIHGSLTRAIQAVCGAQSSDAFKNHAADALGCLIGSDPASLGLLDHLLGLRIQEYLDLFGPMTFVRAVAAEYDLDFIVEEYASANRSRGRARESPLCMEMHGGEQPTSISLVR